MTMKLFILYMLISGQNFTTPTWIANGEFYTKQACYEASKQLGGAQEPHRFKCIAK